MSNQHLIGEFQDPSDPNSRATGDSIALQLTAAAYCIETNNVHGTMHQYLPNWTILWESDPNQMGANGNYAFIAENGLQFALVIKGTKIEFNLNSTAFIHLDISQLFRQTPWNYAYTNSNPQLASATADNLSIIKSLRDKTTGASIAEYLHKDVFNFYKNFCIIGHSLGGSVVPAYALWLKEEFTFNRFKLPELFAVLTFGAPTGFNKDLADIYDQNFTNSWRYYNVLDAIPKITTDLESVKNMYPSPSVLPDQKQIEWIDELNTKLNECQVDFNSYYTHVNQQRGSIALNGTNSSIYSVDGENQFTQWMHQVAAQHDFNNYLDFLQGSKISCTTNSFLGD